MARVPAQCTRCGYRFIPDFFDLNGSITFAGSPTTPCPRPDCNGQAQFLQGTWNAQDGGIEMISGPEWSWDLVQALGLRLRRIVDNPPDDPVAAVHQFSPELAEHIDHAVEEGLRRRGVASTPASRRAIAINIIVGIWNILTVDTSVVGHNLETIGRALLKLLEHYAATGSPPL